MCAVQAAPRPQRHPNNRLSRRGQDGAPVGLRVTPTPLPNHQVPGAPGGRPPRGQGWCDCGLSRPSRSQLETQSRTQHLSLKENGGIEEQEGMAGSGGRRQQWPPVAASSCLGETGPELLFPPGCTRSQHPQGSAEEAEGQVTSTLGLNPQSSSPAVSCITDVKK